MLYSFQQGLLNAPAKIDPDRKLLLLPTEEIKTAKDRLRKSVDRASLRRSGPFRRAAEKRRTAPRFPS